MAHMQISTETSSTWLLQAKDFLVEARRLKPGPARNDLRQVAKSRVGPAGRLRTEASASSTGRKDPLFPLRRSGLAPSSGISTMKATAPLVGRPVTESFRERATSAPKHLWQLG